MQLLHGKKKHFNSGDINGGLVRTSTIKRGFSPHDDSVGQPIRMTLLHNLESIVHGWSDSEKASGRRLVKFTFIYTPTNEIQIDFEAVPKEKYVPGEPIISCIFWEERGQYIVTSVDIILLLEYIVKDSFGVKEKNRIRRNLQSLKPQTVSRSNRLIQRFFNLLMGMENPRPRNIEKDLKVFKWTDLFTALTKVMSKYSRNLSVSPDSMETQKTQRTTNSVTPLYPVKDYQLDVTNVPTKEVSGPFSASNRADSRTSSDLFKSGFNLNDINKKSNLVNGDDPGLYTETSSASESDTHNGDNNSKSVESLQAYNSSVPSFTMTPYHNSSTSITSNAQSSDNSRSDSQEFETSTSGRSKKKRRKIKDKKNKKRAISTYIQDQSDRILGTSPAKNENTINAGSNGNYFKYPAASQLYISMNGITQNLNPDVARNNMYLPNAQPRNDISVEGKVQLPPILSNHYKNLGSNFRNMDSSVDAVQKRSLNKTFANITNDEHSHLHTS